MQHRRQVRQRELRRTVCQWGTETRRHEIVVPFFRQNYKIFGMLGISAADPPVWYPQPPAVVEQRRLAFRSGLSDSPPAWLELPRDLFADAYYHDPWGAVETILPMQSGAPPLDNSVNLAGRELQGRPIVEVLFEPGLHRVRAFVVRQGWFRTHTLPVWRLQALPAATYRPGPRRPQVAGEPATVGTREGWLNRLMRRMLADMLPSPRDNERTDSDPFRP